MYILGMRFVTLLDADVFTFELGLYMDKKKEPKTKIIAKRETRKTIRILSISPHFIFQLIFYLVS